MVKKIPLKGGGIGVKWSGSLSVRTGKVEWVLVTVTLSPARNWQDSVTIVVLERKQQVPFK